MDSASRKSAHSKLEGTVEEGDVNLRIIASVPVNFRSSGRRRSSSVV